MVISLTACSEKGNDYIGKWGSKENANRTVQIEKNGESYLVKETKPSMWTKGELETLSIPASYKDGMLQVQTGMGSVNISYVKGSDTLLMPTVGGTAEYKRLK